jgi:hypothetical protein
MPSILDFLPEFFIAFTERMRKDDERWGDEWLRRPVVPWGEYPDQDDRIFGRFDDYYAGTMSISHTPSGRLTSAKEYLINQETWLKIIGNAFIAWVRLEHPELFPDGVPLPEYQGEDDESL